MEQKFKLTIEQHGTTASVEYDYSDIHVEKLIDAFLDCAASVTWSKNTIIQYILDNYDIED